MTVDPADLRAGQRIDLALADGTEVRNVLLVMGNYSSKSWHPDCLLTADPLSILVRHRRGDLADGVTVTAIRSQPDPELWLDVFERIWRCDQEGTYRSGQSFAADLGRLLALVGPLRPLTPGEPIADGDL